MIAASSGQGATSISEVAKLVLPVTSAPTTIGPTEPPKLPIMLMNPIAEAAAVAPRNMVGIGQNAGKWAYMKVPTQKIITSTANQPSKEDASQMARPERASGTATCQMRSPVRSECQPLTNIA